MPQPVSQQDEYEVAEDFVPVEESEYEVVPDFVPVGEEGPRREKPLVDDLSIPMEPPITEFERSVLRLPKEQRERVFAGQRAMDEVDWNDHFIHAYGAFGRASARTIASAPKFAAVLGRMFEDELSEYIPDFIEQPKDRSARNRWMYRLGSAMERAADNILPLADPRLSDNFMSQTLPTALGSSIGFMVPAALGELSGIPPTATIGVLGAGAEAIGLYEEALASGAPEEQARKAFLYGIPLGATEILGLSRIFKSLKGSVGIKKLLKEAFLSGGENSAQELMQGIGENLVARDLVGFDPNRKLDENALRDAAAGFFVGIMALAGSHAVKYAGNTLLSRPPRALEGLSPEKQPADDVIPEEEPGFIPPQEPENVVVEPERPKTQFTADELLTKDGAERFLRERRDDAMELIRMDHVPTRKNIFTLISDQVRMPLNDRKLFQDLLRRALLSEQSSKKVADGEQENDTKNEGGLQGGEQIGEEPGGAIQERVGGEEAASPGGVFQAQETLNRGEADAFRVAYEKAMRNMASRLTGGSAFVNAPLDPAFYKDLLDIAKYLVSRGARSFVEFSRRLSAELPEPVRKILTPNLRRKLYSDSTRGVLTDRAALKLRMMTAERASRIGYRAGIKAARDAAELKAAKRRELYEKRIERLEKIAERRRIKEQIKSLVRGFYGGLQEGRRGTILAERISNQVSSISFQRIWESFRELDKSRSVKWNAKGLSVLEKIRAMLQHLHASGLGPKTDELLAPAWEVIDRLSPNAKLTSLLFRDLKPLKDAVDMFVAELKLHKAMIVGEKLISVENISNRLVNEIYRLKRLKAPLFSRLFIGKSAVKPKPRKWFGRRFVGELNMTLSTLVDGATGVTKSALRQLYEAVAVGMSKSDGVMVNMHDRIEEMEKELGITEQDKIDMETKAVKTKIPRSGVSVELTPFERISLAMNLERKSTIKSILKRGFTTTRKAGLPSERIQLLRGASQAQRLHDEIVDSFTTKERGYYDLFKKFYAELAEQINETTVQKLGYRIAIEPNWVKRYLDVTASRRNIKDEMDGRRWIRTYLEDLGILQPSSVADATVVIKDARQAMFKHVHDASRYAHAVIPIRNMLVVLGQPDVAEAITRTNGEHYGDIIIERLRESTGIGASLDEFMRGFTPWINRLTSNVATSVLAYAPSPIIANPIASNLIAAHMLREGGSRAASLFYKSYADPSIHWPSPITPALSERLNRAARSNGYIALRLRTQAEHFLISTNIGFAGHLSKTRISRLNRTMTQYGLRAISREDSANTLAAFEGWLAELNARQAEAVQNQMKLDPSLTVDEALDIVSSQDPELAPENIEVAAGTRAMYAIRETQNPVTALDRTSFQHSLALHGLGFLNIFTAGQGMIGQFARTAWMRMMRNPRPRERAVFVASMAAVAANIALMAAFGAGRRKLISTIRGEQKRKPGIAERAAIKVASDIADSVVAGSGKIINTVADLIYSGEVAPQTIFGQIFNDLERSAIQLPQGKQKAKNMLRLSRSLAKLLGSPVGLMDYAKLGYDAMMKHQKDKSWEKRRTFVSEGE